MLLVGDHAIFESAVILEYLEETQANPLHPANALHRAEHRAWIEFGSAVLNDIAGLYSAPDEAAFKAKAAQLEASFARLEAASRRGPGSTARNSRWSMPCSVRCSAISTCSTRSAISAFSTGKPKLARWRAALAARPSVKSAVSADYPALAARLHRPAAFLALAIAGEARGLSQVSAAIFASTATVFMLRAVPAFRGGDDEL